MYILGFNCHPINKEEVILGSLQERIANPAFVSLVEKAYQNESMHELFEILYSRELPKVEQDSFSNEEIQSWIFFTELVHKLIWKSLHPEEPIELTIN